MNAQVYQQIIDSLSIIYNPLSPPDNRRNAQQVLVLVHII